MLITTTFGKRIPTIPARLAGATSAGCLVMVVGGLTPGSRDLPGARARVAEGIDRLVPVAADHGVRLALEPMHPIFTADRVVLAPLGEPLDLAEPDPADQVGVVVDSFHVRGTPSSRPSSRARPGGSRASRCPTGSPRCRPTRCCLGA